MAIDTRRFRLRPLASLPSSILGLAVAILCLSNNNVRGESTTSPKPPPIPLTPLPLPPVSLRRNTDSSSGAGGTMRGRQLYGSLTRQQTDLQFHPVPGHRHMKHLQSRLFASSSDDRQSRLGPQLSSILSIPPSVSRTIRVGFAGGIAGAIGTAALYPFDCAKTLRQSNPTKYKSVRHALLELCKPISTSVSSTTSSSLSSLSASASSASSPVWGSSTLSWWQRIPGTRAYNGLLASTLGAIPSSALYFGAYESMKRLIRTSCASDVDGSSTVSSRLLVHAAAAASGNVISSAVFVPKELIKQQMQYGGTSMGSTIWTIISDHGIRGLYRGYQATLLRNIPSAMLRFVLYEELKRSWYYGPSGSPAGDGAHHHSNAFSWKLFAAGAVAGAVASGIMTPIDVLKTRLSTGTCPVDVPGCLQYVLKEQGWSGLYAGAGSRMAFSGAFSAIGFASFEAAKTWLGVSSDRITNTTSDATTVMRPMKPSRPRRIMTDKQSWLERVLEDKYEQR